MNDGGRIARRVEEKCKSALQKIEKAGIPPEVVVSMAVTAAEGWFDLFSPDIKEWFRSQIDRANRLREPFEEARKIPWMPQDLPKRLKDYAENLGEYLRQNRADHDEAIPLVVYSVRTYRRDFNKWTALASVLDQAYKEAGRRPVTANMLRKARKAATRIFEESGGGT